MAVARRTASLAGIVASDVVGAVGLEARLDVGENAGQDFVPAVWRELPGPDRAGEVRVVGRPQGRHPLSVAGFRLAAYRELPFGDSQRVDRHPQVEGAVPRDVVAERLEKLADCLDQLRRRRTAEELTTHLGPSAVRRTPSRC